MLVYLTYIMLSFQVCYNVSGNQSQNHGDLIFAISSGWSADLAADSLVIFFMP